MQKKEVQIRNGKKHYKIFIATPAYGHQVMTTYANSMFRLMATKSPEDFSYNCMIHLQSGMALVTQARNNCVAEFMKSGADKLLFIDADIGFQPEAVQRLIRFDADVVLTPYPVKGYMKGDHGISFIIHFKEKNNIQVDKDGFCEIKAGPTGFMMIDRSVIEKMAEHYPEKKCANRQMVGNKVEVMNDYWYTFFDTAVDPKNGYLGEDIAFCNLWTKIGGKIYADTKTRLIHYGGHSFSGSLDMVFGKNDSKFKFKTVDDIRKNK